MDGDTDEPPEEETDEGNVIHAEHGTGRDPAGHPVTSPWFGVSPRGVPEGFSDLPEVLRVTLPEITSDRVWESRPTTGRVLQTLYSGHFRGHTDHPNETTP